MFLHGAGPGQFGKMVPGLGGVAPEGADESEAYVLQNMVVDRDGYFRPRPGMSHVAAMGGTVTHLSHTGSAALMCIANSGVLSKVVANTGSATTVDTGWPDVFLQHCLATKVDGTSVWVACKQRSGGGIATGGYDGRLYYYDGTSLSAAVTAAGQGDWVSNHNDMVLRVAGADYYNAGPLQWSNRGDITDWPESNTKNVKLGELRHYNATIPFTQQETIILGSDGIGLLTGTTPKGLQIRPMFSLAVTTPCNNVVKGRDRIFIPAGGPTIYEYLPPGNLRPIQAPIYRDLYAALGAYANVVSFYDPVGNNLCVTDLTNKKTWLYNIDTGRWIGTWVYADGTYPFRALTVIDQATASSDAQTQPWARCFWAAGSNILKSDASVYADATSSGSSTAFSCVVESQPSDSGDRSVDKQITDVYVDGTGSVTVYLKTRTDPDGAWTSTDLGTISAPGWVNPGVDSLPIYRERVIGVRGNSSSTLRLKGIYFQERLLGGGLA